MLLVGSGSPLGRLASTLCAGNEVKSLQGAGCQPQSNQLHSLPLKKTHFLSHYQKIRAKEAIALWEKPLILRS